MNHSIHGILPSRISFARLVCFLSVSFVVTPARENETSERRDYPAEQAGALSIQVKTPHETKRAIETIIACLRESR